MCYNSSANLVGLRFEVYVNNILYFREKRRRSRIEKSELIDGRPSFHF